MSKNIGYHTRLYSDNTVKVTGGSFGGQIDMETVERLTRLFTVTVKQSGRPVFVDREGREVNLYLSVDVSSTQKGKEALMKWRKEKEEAEAADERKREKQKNRIDELLGSMSYEEVIARLTR